MTWSGFCARKRAESVTQNIEKLVDIGGFKIKGCTISGSQNEGIPSEMYAPTEKVLAVCWRPVEDHFFFKVALNFSGRKRKLHTEPDIEPNQLMERFLRSWQSEWFSPRSTASMIHLDWQVHSPLEQKSWRESNGCVDRSVWIGTIQCVRRMQSRVEYILFRFIWH